MSTDNAIVAHFGGDTSDLRDATDEASIIMKGFSTSAGRSIKEIGEGFVGAVVFEEVLKGIKDIASAEIDAAQKAEQMSQITGQALTSEQQAWLDLGNTSSQTWTYVKQDIGSVLAPVPEMGESFGKFLSGVSETSSSLYTKIANDSTANIATITAARNAYLADYQAKAEALNTKLDQLDTQLAAANETHGDELVALVAKQDAEYLQLNATQSGTVAGAQLLVKIRTDELNILKLRDQLAKEEITTDNQSYNAVKSQLTVTDQITALYAQQSVYLYKSAAAAQGTAEQQTYANEAAKIGDQILEANFDLQQRGKLSVADQTALYIAQTPALANLNKLNADQVNLLQKQQDLSQGEANLTDLINKNYENGTQAQKDQVTTQIEKNAKLQQQIDLITQAVTAENALGAAATKTLDIDEQADAAQDEADSASGGEGGISARTDILSGSGVGGVNQQYQDSQSVANARANLESLQKNLQNQINGYQNSDDPTEENLVPALQAKIAALHQQEINISPQNLNGTPPPAYAAPTSAQQATTQTQLLQGIHDALVPALKG